MNGLITKPSCCAGHESTKSGVNPGVEVHITVDLERNNTDPLCLQARPMFSSTTWESSQRCTSEMPPRSPRSVVRHLLKAMWKAATKALRVDASTTDHLRTLEMCGENCACGGYEYMYVQSERNLQSSWESGENGGMRGWQIRRR